MEIVRKEAGGEERKIEPVLGDLLESLLLEGGF